MTGTLWDDFHRVVNMTSHELEDWLRTRSADEDSETVPDQAGIDQAGTDQAGIDQAGTDQAGTPTGQEVLRVLRKRRTDLTTEDVKVMREVVERVRAQRREDLEPTAGEARWRHRLMSLGHDPLKPA
ncbi:DUF3140 domain-containing protein [Saccharothrix sp. 6-C]|uniref:DUF3140 domain-containing protein n=1 Tax=Saccharothrix sp. 6-C TaxID=2781735 RepID=UPI0019176391|nr:DUF3140 domain-containing protein [Saccharothrix sp. 6-C]QQQ78596.1 DUF3140 domain-containing protein [Saccharothrix sp. 6-C]